jgi:hypothetical protein
MRHTQRGFAIYSEFRDVSGCTIRVQESSLATASAVWIFCDSNNPEYKNPSPQLTKPQAKRMIKALQKFVDGQR